MFEGTCRIYMITVPTYRYVSTVLVGSPHTSHCNRRQKYLRDVSNMVWGKNIGLFLRRPARDLSCTAPTTGCLGSSLYVQRLSTASSRAALSWTCISPETLSTRSTSSLPRCALATEKAGCCALQGVLYVLLRGPRSRVTVSALPHPCPHQGPMSHPQ